jgi:hypothetical protein
MRLITWLKDHRPSREAMMKNRWLRPFARTLGNPNIWHFNRRSVARGFALGMFFGVAIPFAQAPAAAVFAVPLRANLPVAALITFVSNPLTTPLIYLASYEVGRWLLQMQDDPVSMSMAADTLFESVTQLLTKAPLPIGVGMITLATLGAVLGFAAIHVVWRVWIQQRMLARRSRDLPSNAPAR